MKVPHRLQTRATQCTPGWTWTVCAAPQYRHAIGVVLDDLASSNWRYLRIMLCSAASTAICAMSMALHTGSTLLSAGSIPAP